MFVVTLLIAACAASDNKLSSFLTWANANKVYAHDIDIRETATFGNAVFARSLISEGKAILKVPFDVMLNADVAYRSEVRTRGSSFGISKIGGPLFQAELIDADALAVYLLHLRLTRNPRWTPFIDLFPRTLDTPFVWGDADLETLRDSSTYELLEQRLVLLRSSYDRAVQRLFSARRDLFPAEGYTLSNFTWAHGIIRSRLFHIRDKAHDFYALVPFADLFNNALARDVQTLERVENSVLELVATRPLSADEQVFSFYSSGLPNSVLLMDYGFVLRGNPAPEPVLVDVAVPGGPASTEPASRVERKKLAIDRLLHHERSPPGSTLLQLGTTDVSSTVLQALRIRFANRQELKQLLSSKAARPVSAGNELLVWRHLSLELEKRRDRLTGSCETSFVGDDPHEQRAWLATTVKCGEFETTRQLLHVVKARLSVLLTREEV